MGKLGQTVEGGGNLSMYVCVGASSIEEGKENCNWWRWDEVVWIPLQFVKYFPLFKVLQGHTGKDWIAVLTSALTF